MKFSARKTFNCDKIQIGKYFVDRWDQEGVMLSKYSCDSWITELCKKKKLFPSRKKVHGLVNEKQKLSFKQLVLELRAELSVSLWRFMHSIHPLNRWKRTRKPQMKLLWEKDMHFRLPSHLINNTQFTLISSPLCCSLNKWGNVQNCISPHFPIAL